MDCHQIDIVSSEEPPIHVKRITNEHDIFKIISSVIAFDSQVSTGYKWINPSNESVFEYAIYLTDENNFYMSSFHVDTTKSNPFISLFTGVRYEYDSDANGLQENEYTSMNCFGEINRDSFSPIYQRMFDELKNDIPNLVDYQSLEIN